MPKEQPGRQLSLADGGVLLIVVLVLCGAALIYAAASY